MDFGRLPGARTIGDGNGNGRAHLDVEDADITVDPRSWPPPQVAAQVDDLDPIKAVAHHLPQTGIGPAGQELAVGDEGDDPALRGTLGLEDLPHRPAPEGHRQFREGVELVALMRFAHRAFQIVPQRVHPLANERAVLAFLQSPVRWVSDDGENWLLGLDPVGGAAFFGYSRRDETQPAERCRRTWLGQCVGKVDAQPRQRRARSRCRRVTQGVVQPVMRHRIGPDEQFEAEHPPCQVAQFKVCPALPTRYRGFVPDPFCHAEQECSGPCGRIEDRQVRIAQPVQPEVGASDAVKRAGHEPHDLDRCEVYAVAFPCCRVEDRQKVLVEIQDRVALAGLNCEDLRREAVHRVHKHGEANPDNIEDFRLRQDTQRGAHQRMLSRHVLISSCIDRATAAFPNEQQAESECLCEGRGKQDIKVLRRVAARLGMRIKDGLEFSVNIEQRVCCHVLLPKIGQSVLNDSAHQPR